MQKRKLTAFGQRVKERLYELNMTQKTLAKKVGTSEAYLSMILYGERSGAKYKDKIKSVIYASSCQSVNNKE